MKRIAVAGAVLWPTGAQAATGQRFSGLVFDIEPVTAIWLGSLLFFLTGFAAGALTLHFLERFAGKGRR